MCVYPEDVTRVKPGSCHLCDRSKKCEAMDPVILYHCMTYPEDGNQLDLAHRYPEGRNHKVQTSEMPAGCSTISN